MGGPEAWPERSFWELGLLGPLVAGDTPLAFGEALGTPTSANTRLQPTDRTNDGAEVDPIRRTTAASPRVRTLGDLANALRPARGLFCWFCGPHGSCVMVHSEQEGRGTLVFPFFLFGLLLIFINVCFVEVRAAILSIQVYIREHARCTGRLWGTLLVG